MVSLLPFLRAFLTDVFFCRRKCPLPCGVLGADLGSSSALGASFSVSVLNEAQGSDGCLLEPQTEYEVDGALLMMVRWFLCVFFFVCFSKIQPKKGESIDVFFFEGFPDGKTLVIEECAFEFKAGGGSFIFLFTKCFCGTTFLWHPHRLQRKQRGKERNLPHKDVDSVKPRSSWAELVSNIPSCRQRVSI